MGAGLEIQVTTAALQHMVDRLEAYQGQLKNPKGLARGIAAMLEAQVKHRIQDEKKDPEGNPWQEWSPAYAARAKSNHSLLLFEGRLRDSIAGRAVNGSTVTVGSDMVYARVHQLGYDPKHIPARPYLGISKENADEIADLVIDWAERIAP